MELFRRGGPAYRSTPRLGMVPGGMVAVGSSPTPKNLRRKPGATSDSGLTVRVGELAGPEMRN